MNAAAAAMSEVEFGFAPLLEVAETRLRLETGPDGTVAKLAYPLQPEDPAQWPAVDSFVLSYATQISIQGTGQAQRVALGEFELAAPIADRGDTINHVAVWVTFVDGTQAVVDLSPLSTDFAALHKAEEFLGNFQDVQAQFTTWRGGVFLNQLQPLAVIEEGGDSYYLIAQVLVFPDRYQFSLRAHPVQVADPLQPLRLVQGTMVSSEFERAEFELLREELLSAGPTIFNTDATLTQRQGSDNTVLHTILDDHLDLLWLMVTKLEHIPPAPDELLPATPTVTPSPTSTPTPTPTPTPLLDEPLLTS